MNVYRLLGGAGLVVLAGCFGGGPSPVRPPDVDPDAAATQALELYDRNGDGALAGAELDPVPAYAGVRRQRRRAGERGGGRPPPECTVRLGSRPFAGARLRAARWEAAAGGTVLFEPEPFLGESVKPAAGVTGPGGMATMAVPEELLPESERGLEAMQVGLYKVRITHPQAGIPARYNQRTILGFELDPGVVLDEPPRFDLQSR